jgi:ubiquinone/menaquinone biosynthesis C-methylase UbiE
MDHATALHLIEEVLPSDPEIWADLGAGTGLFTEVLRDHLPAGSAVHALDKSPHMLWRLAQRPEVPIHIHDEDFTREMDLPLCDGLLMANALHYVSDPALILQQILNYLKPSGLLIMIEYEVSQPVGPYIPYPLPLMHFTEVAKQVGLTQPEVMATVPSRFGHEHIYAAKCVRRDDR